VCGLSVNTDVAETKKRLAKLRKKIAGYRFSVVAAIEVTPDAGVIKATPSNRAGKSHHTWWVPVGIRPWADLKIKIVP
jgi:hypothetical protein